MTLKTPRPQPVLGSETLSHPDLHHLAQAWVSVNYRSSVNVNDTDRRGRLFFSSFFLCRFYFFELLERPLLV